MEDKFIIWVLIEKLMEMVIIIVVGGAIGYLFGYKDGYGIAALEGKRAREKKRGKEDDVDRSIAAEAQEDPADWWKKDGWDE